MHTLCFLLSIFVLVPEIRSSNPDDEKSIAEYLISYGYVFQEHKVVTPDGYILTLWRIPSKLPLKRPLGPPVILQHGIIDNGFSFLFQDIAKNLPIMLLEQAGFDVWIGNIRGNVRSLEHVDKENYNWEEYGGKYWDFSWDEMVKYDFKSIVDYVMKETGHDTVRYVCHSQGCTMLLLFGCSDSEYVNTHISQAVMMAPAMFFSEQRSTFMNVILKSNALAAFETANEKNVLADTATHDFSRNLGKTVPSAWLEMVNLLCGETPTEQIDEKRVSVLASNEFGGTSLQNIKHWVQMIENSTVRMYDFGPQNNLKRYGVPYAPAYNLTNLISLKVPMMVFGFECDTLITTNATKRLLTYLPSDSYIFEIVPGVNHVSGFWGDSAYKDLNPKIVAFLGRTVYNIVSQ